MVSPQGKPKQRRSLQWPRRARFGLPRASDGFNQLKERYCNERWVIGEARLGIGEERRFLSADREIVGASCVGRCRPSAELSLGLNKWRPQEVFSRLSPHVAGDWALKTGLVYDPRLRDRYDRKALGELFRLAGPLQAALMAHHHGLHGYFAALLLERLHEFSPALDAPAFVQQVQAGAIDAPLLTEHLHYGARPIALVDTGDAWLVILRWRRR